MLGCMSAPCTPSLGLASLHLPTWHETPGPCNTAPKERVLQGWRGSKRGGALLPTTVHLTLVLLHVSEGSKYVLA